MNAVPTVKVTQPHIEQIHDHLENALTHNAALKKLAIKAGFVEMFPTIDEAEYEIRTATQYLPPRQSKLPF
jgi:spore coat protein CotF